MQRLLFFNPESITAVCRFNTVLRPYVFHDHLVRHVPTRRHEVTTCPQMSTPIHFLQMPELHQQLPRRFALDQLHDLTRGQIRRTRQQHMHVIARDGSLQDFDLLRPTDLPNQIAEPNSDLARQDAFSVLRHPNEVKLDVESTV